MAVLYIAEFPALEVGGIPAAIAPPLAEQTLAIGSSSVASNPFGAQTGMVRIHADAICSIKFGGSPTATAANARLAASQTEYYMVHTGQQVAVIVNT